MSVDTVDLFEGNFRDTIITDGWWMVLRSFDLTKRSKYWTGVEAIGGPTWEFRDIITRGRKVEAVHGDVMTFVTREQFTENYSAIFYMASRIRPKKEDIIIEIPMEMKHAPKPPKIVRPNDWFYIEHVESKIDGRLIFSTIYCSSGTPRNDVTLKGPLPVRYISLK